MSHDLTPTQLDLRHQVLIDQRAAIGGMPIDTHEQKLARYEKRAEVSLALAEVYATKQRDVEPGTIVWQALVVAERDSRDSAERAQQIARNVRSRIAAAKKQGDDAGEVPQ
jgi:hypothetical protein